MAKVNLEGEVDTEGLMFEDNRQPQADSAAFDTVGASALGGLLGESDSSRPSTRSAPSRPASRAAGLLNPGGGGVEGAATPLRDGASRRGGAMGAFSKDLGGRRSSLASREGSRMRLTSYAQ